MCISIQRKGKRLGNKISWEDAERLGALSTGNDSVYAPQNKYDYKININHPKIRPLYEHYKRRIGAIILSDVERFQFEAAIIKMIERGKNKDEQSNSDRQTDC